MLVVVTGGPTTSARPAAANVIGDGEACEEVQGATPPCRSAVGRDRAGRRRGARRRRTALDHRRGRHLAALTNASHTGVTITAACASGRLVSGGSFLRLVDAASGGSSPGPGLPNVPTNGLVLGGSVPSAGTVPVDGEVADGTVDPTDWMTISNFTGQAEAGDQASSFALCATGGPSHTVVRAASRTGPNAQQATTAATDANLLVGKSVAFVAPVT
jgi:hypothetical protein